MTVRFPILAFAAVVALATPLLAFFETNAEYDGTYRVVATGKLVAFEWPSSNTREAWATVETVDPRGGGVKWAGRFPSTHPHIAAGWKKEAILALVGRTVAMCGAPSKSGQPRMEVRLLVTDKEEVLGLEPGIAVRAENGVVTAAKKGAVLPLPEVGVTRSRASSADNGYSWCGLPK